MTGDVSSVPPSSPLMLVYPGNEPAATSRGESSPVDCWTLVLIIAFGAFLVAVAFALGRHHVTGATAPYWFGQALVLLPTAWANFSRSTDARAKVISLTATAAAQSLLTWCYSPDQFRYGDELQHVVTAENILATHHLFSANALLPVSSGFPGLEIATSALVQVTGLSLFHAGVIVVSLSHIALPIAVFLLFRELTRNDRLAGAAAFVYSLAPHYSYFNTLFLYSVPAITFLVLVLYAAISSWRRRTNPLWIVAAFTPLLITHHVSAIAAIAILFAFALVIFLSGNGRPGLFLAAITVLLADDLIAWAEIHSPSTFSYLWQPIVSSLSGGSPSTSVTIAGYAAQPPIWEHYTGELAAVVMFLLILLGIRLTWKQSQERFPRLLALLGLVYGAILGLRLFSSDGPELATRALTYGMLLVAYPVAIAVTWLCTSRPSQRFLRRGFALIPFAVIPLLLVGAIVTGLPASWERIPGTFRVDGLESGMDERVAAVGQWAAASWTAGQRVACDTSVCAAFGAYALAVPSTTASPLYYVTTVKALNQGLRKLATDYIETDSRTTTQLPATGSYFPSDVEGNEHQSPLASSLLAKFDQDRLLERVYDDGDIRVYYAGRTW